MVEALIDEGLVLQKLRKMHKVTLQVLVLWTISTALPAMQQCCDLFSDGVTPHHSTTQKSKNSHHHAVKDVRKPVLHANAGHHHDAESSHHANLEPCDFENEASTAINVEPIKFTQFAINSRSYYFDEHLFETVSFYLDHSPHRYQEREIYLLTSRLRI